jgi:hypothetical protein
MIENEYQFLMIVNPEYVTPDYVSSKPIGGIQRVPGAARR